MTITGTMDRFNSGCLPNTQMKPWKLLKGSLCLLVHAGWLSPDLKAFNTNVEILGKDWEQRACWEDVHSGYGLFLDHIFPLILELPCFLLFYVMTQRPKLTLCLRASRQQGQMCPTEITQQ